MCDWIEAYTAADDFDRKYGLLREELARLRGRSHESEAYEKFDPDRVASTLADLGRRVDGHLIAFVANDFGRPVAFRPAGLPRDVQNEVRREILRGKYDRQADLDEIRRALLERFPPVHKAIVVDYAPDGIRYHLPEGSTETTSFLTVREMVGLVDYTTNSAQSDDLSMVY